MLVRAKRQRKKTTCPLQKPSLAFPLHLEGFCRGGLWRGNWTAPLLLPSGPLLGLSSPAHVRVSLFTRLIAGSKDGEAGVRWSPFGCVVSRFLLNWFDYNIGSVILAAWSAPCSCKVQGWQRGNFALCPKTEGPGPHVTYVMLVSGHMLTEFAEKPPFQLTQRKRTSKQPKKKNTVVLGDGYFQSSLLLFIPRYKTSKTKQTGKKSGK